MNEKELSRFIEKELRGLWSEWNPSDAELCVWSEALERVPYAVALKAAHAVFQQQRTNYRRPVFRKFIEQVHLRGGSTTRRRERPDPTTTVYVECFEPPAGKPHLRGVRKGVFTTRQDDPDYVLAHAESMRGKHEQLYGGHWIVVRTRPLEDAGRPTPPKLRNAANTGENTAGALPEEKFDEK